ncbi:GFA family protein [Mesorhizobium sp. NPDC059054]|uniref:GFA family protein n=1 Tax=Mesorhizobium sp. NPDC059054 TaxID=3346711 RepID=UPI0036C182D0
MIEAVCHCGQVRLRLPRKPRVITACNCSFCRRQGPLFAYYTRRSIEVVAPDNGFERYVWGKGVLTWLRCRNCGCFTHHIAAHAEGDLDRRTGINLRLVDPGLLMGITVKLRDGASGSWKVLRSYRFDTG